MEDDPNDDANLPKPPQTGEDSEDAQLEVIEQHHQNQQISFPPEAVSSH